MKKQLLFVYALGITATAGAQTADRQVIGTSGASYAGAAIQVDYTVGEAVTNSGTSGSFSVNQGFQQNTINGTGIKEKDVVVSFSLYPNPAQDHITLSVSPTAPFAMKLSLINSIGELITADEHAENISQNYKRDIPVLALAAGVYFVNLYDSKNGLLQSIRFVKQ